MPMFGPPVGCVYVDTTRDGIWQYRRVTLSDDSFRRLQRLPYRSSTIEEGEWLEIGVLQSSGWMRIGTEGRVAHFRKPLSMVMQQRERSLQQAPPQQAPQLSLSPRGNSSAVLTALAGIFHKIQQPALRRT